MKHGPPLLLVGAIVAATGLFYVFGPKQPPALSRASKIAKKEPALAVLPREASNPTISQPPRKFVTIEELNTSPHALDPTPLKLNFGAPPFQRQTDGTIHKTDVILTLRDLNKADHEPEEDLQLLRNVIGAYHEIFQQNPVAGENWEVVDALSGKNPHKLAFLDPAHPALNARRELLDRWGTPYRFHPLSGSHMEFSSAGADGTFGTKDDLHLEEPTRVKPEDGT